jgi:hypothetical protein
MVGKSLLCSMNRKKFTKEYNVVCNVHSIKDGVENWSRSDYMLYF